MSDRQRRRAGIALVVLAALLLAVTAIAGYTRTALVDEQEFSARATSALGTRTSARSWPTASSAGSRATWSPTRWSCARSSSLRSRRSSTPGRSGGCSPALTLARALVNGDTSFAFELPLGEGLVFESLQSVAPGIARAIPADLRVPILRLDPRDFELSGARFLNDLAGLSSPLLMRAAGRLRVRRARRGRLSSILYLSGATAGASLTVAAFRGRVRRVRRGARRPRRDLAEETERAAVRAIWDRAVRRPPQRGAARRRSAAPSSRCWPPARFRARFPAVAWRGRAGWPVAGPAVQFARSAALIALGAALVVEPALVGRALVIAGGVLVALSAPRSSHRRPRPPPRGPGARPRSRWPARSSPCWR